MEYKKTEKPSPAIFQKNLTSELRCSVKALAGDVMMMELLTENYDECRRRYGGEIINACLRRMQNYLEQHTEEISLLGRLAARQLLKPGEEEETGEPRQKERD